MTHSHLKGSNGTAKAFSGLFLAAGLGFAAPVYAQEKIDVSIVSGFSPAVAAVKMLKESFMPGVDARLAATQSPWVGHPLVLIASQD